MCSRTPRRGTGRTSAAFRALRLGNSGGSTAVCGSKQADAASLAEGRDRVVILRGDVPLVAGVGILVAAPTEAFEIVLDGESRATQDERAILPHEEDPRLLLAPWTRSRSLLSRHPRNAWIC
jgi:hypothetical protein